MYFTDTSELREFEKEMRQKPNFDRRNDDCYENNQAHFSDIKNVHTNRKKDGGRFYDNKNQESYLSTTLLSNRI